MVDVSDSLKFGASYEEEFKPTNDEIKLNDGEMPFEKQIR